MTPKIEILDDHIANQIAAGEVVERPASVVKELVENAIDAGATRIRVELVEGGRDRIRVLDNGHGMRPDDALLALRRHATSKVSNTDDLNHIGTLGFRGEALPSIRSVSRFRLRTRTEDALEGVEIIADGAKEPTCTPIGCPPGTDIQIEDLFFNTPARRKFLRRASTEFGRITEIMERFALGWPAVHFTVIHNGKRRADYPAETSLSGRMVRVLGNDLCRKMAPVRLEMGYWHIQGFLAPPSETKGSVRHLYSYVNRRFVRDKVLQHAICQAFGSAIERGRYPIGVLHLSIPPDDVDVNVHPAKAEVRFTESGAMHGFVSRAVKLTLSEAWSGELEGLEGLPPASGQPLPGVPAPGNSSLSGGPGVRPVSSAEPTSQTNFIASPSWSSEAETYSSTVAMGDGTIVRVMGQLQNQYLLCESEGVFHVVDPHSAHQRVLYDALSVELGTGRIRSQRLLFPAQTILNPAQAASAERFENELLVLGFRLEPFGGAEWVLSEVPHVLANVSAVTVVDEILTELAKGKLSPPDVPDAFLSTLAYHAAYSRGDRLTQEEAVALLSELHSFAAHDNGTYGAPIAVSYTMDQISRWFQRT